MLERGKGMMQDNVDRDDCCKVTAVKDFPVANNVTVDLDYVTQKLLANGFSVINFNNFYDVAKWFIGVLKAPLTGWLRRFCECA